MSQTSTGLPRFGRPAQSKERCGLPRSTLYEVAAQNKGVFKKLNGKTIVDYGRVDSILAKLPDAELKNSKGK